MFFLASSFLVTIAPVPLLLCLILSSSVFITLDIHKIIQINRHFLQLFFFKFNQKLHWMVLNIQLIIIETINLYLLFLQRIWETLSRFSNPIYEEKTFYPLLIMSCLPCDEIRLRLFSFSQSFNLHFTFEEMRIYCGSLS